MGDSPKSSAPPVVAPVVVPKPEIKAAPANDSPVQIEDILAIGELVVVPGPMKVAKTPLGEFGNLAANTNDQASRLFTHIKGLVEDASKEHKKQNCDNTGKLKKECENNIVR